MRPRTVFITHDPYMCPEIIAQVRTQISPEAVWITPVTSLYDTLCKTMNSLEKISVRYKSSGCAVVTLKSSIPYVRVNENLVMTTTGKLVRAHEFKSSLIALLPRITCTDRSIDEGSQYAADCGDFLVHLPADFFRDYHVIIQDKTCIQLVCHTQPITLIAWYKTRFSSELLHGIIQLIGRSKQLSQHAMYKTKKWLIDVRMTKKLILTPV